MIDVAELTAWLLKQVDADESMAYFAIFDGSTGEWSEPNSGTLDLGIPDSCLEGLVSIGDQRISRFAEHFDPARQLREVEAKRQTLTEHAPEPRIGATERGAGGEIIGRLAIVGHNCRVCGGQRVYPWPCQTVRLIASLYDGRSGYRAEWAPEATDS